MKLMIILVLITASYFLMGSSKPHKPCQTLAEINGFSELKTLCSWGWNVKIGDTNFTCANLRDYQVTYNNDSLKNHPIEVLFTYEIEDNRCIDYIKVTCLTKLPSHSNK